MRSPWQALRSLFARVGSDPYYASYDRSLGNIKSEVDRVQVGGRVVLGRPHQRTCSCTALLLTVLFRLPNA